MRFGNKKVFFVIAFFFLLAGIALFALGSSTSVTDLLGIDAMGNDSSGGILQLIGAIWVGVAVLLLVMGSIMSRRAARDRDLQESGQQAPARVLEVRGTGVVSNMVNIGFEADLEVQQPDGRTFRATVKDYTPASSMPLPGDVVMVSYDPGDTSNVTLVTYRGADIAGGKVLVGADGMPLAQSRGAAAATPSAEPGIQVDDVAMLERLSALHRDGALSDSEFEEQKRRLLGEPDAAGPHAGT